MTDFYTGSPMEPEDLWFRDEFIDRLWEILRGEHVLLSAPRRTGKTSVMDHLAARPRDGFTPVSVFVQDLDHPNEFLLTLLDAFHAKHPNLFRTVFQSAVGWIGPVLERLEEVDVAGFKVALREQLPSGPDGWREFGDREFFQLTRRSGHKLLFIVDEFPDLIVNMRRKHPDLVRPFLGWLRGHCVNPRPRQDNLRWLLGGSVNLSSTLDSLDALDLINAFHDESLPVLTDSQVAEFVKRMLTERSVEFDTEVPNQVARLLGRPVPYFLQMITQNLYRWWKRKNRRVLVADVQQCFEELIVSSAARDKLQHFYSRIQQYYEDPKRSAAYALLAKLSVSEEGLGRSSLQQHFDRVLHERGATHPEYERRQLFNQLLRDLENDFYVSEIRADSPDGSLYDFSSGLLKSWWRKYYA